MSEAAAASNVQSVFDEVVRERGGREALSIAEVALARTLALALTSDPVDARVISVILERLPPAKPQGKAFDFSRLSLRELGVVESLLSVAAGEERPVPKEPKPPRRQRTRREIIALELAGVLDSIEAGGRLERATLRGGVMRLLAGVCEVHDLWPATRPVEPAKPELSAKPELAGEDDGRRPGESLSALRFDGNLYRIGDKPARPRR